MKNQRKPADPVNIDRRYQASERRHVYVYGIMFDGNVPGPVKVGHAANPKSRVASIELCIPFRCRLHFQMECPPGASAAVEARAHQYLRDFAIRNEWFAVHPSQAIEAVRRAHAAVTAEVRDEIVLRRSHVSAVQEILGLCNSHCAQRYGLLLHEWTAMTGQSQSDPMVKPIERAVRLQNQLADEGFLIEPNKVTPPPGLVTQHWSDTDCLHCFKFGKPHYRVLERFFQNELGWTAQEIADRSGVSPRIAAAALRGARLGLAELSHIYRAVVAAGISFPTDRDWRFEESRAA